LWKIKKKLFLPSGKRKNIFLLTKLLERVFFMNRKLFKIGLLCIFLLLITSFSFTISAQDTSATTTQPTISIGNTAWILVATAFVLLMTIPGLALFYGGLVRRKNVLNILMQCFIITAVISIEWVIFGYSNAFGHSDGFLSPYIGGFHWAFLNGIGVNDPSPYVGSMPNQPIPHIVFVMYQCMFAIITPALIIGAFAERIKFKGFLIFSLLWAIVVYNPVAHWIWSKDGWLYNMGVLDFAGGIVVHITAGISALVMAIMVGKRKYYEGGMTPHNIPFVVIGAGLLWFGWFGFNAGSGLAADGVAANAFMVTHIAAAMAALTWAILDWTLNTKPTTIGICTGAIAGLAAITPTAGFVDLKAALIISIISSVVCFIMVGKIKVKYKYDDSLDAFGVHGVAGIIGSLLVGVFASPAVQSSYSGLLYGNAKQLWVQTIAVVVAVVYSLILTYLLFKIVDKLFGLRANSEEESTGLDFTQHDEIAYTEAE
jgi:Amt family ammonium transporter